MFSSLNMHIWLHFKTKFLIWKCYLVYSSQKSATRYVQFGPKNCDIWHFLKLFCQMSTKTSGNAVRTLGQIIWWYFCTTILKILLSPLYSKQCMCRTASESLIYPVECKGRFQTHSDRIILGKVHIKQLFW